LENIAIEQKVLLQFTEKGGDNCVDAIYGSVDKLS
jgi:hypothetical protein